MQQALLNFNANLSTMLSQFSGVHLVDINSRFTDILNHPSEYGFDKDKLSQTCPNRNTDCAGYLFADDVHPTIKGHQYIADEVKKHILTLR